MTLIREQKVALVASNIPDQVIEGDAESDSLLISWGGTYGAVHEAVKKVNQGPHKVAHVHLQYLNPFPKNFVDILKNYKNKYVAELNTGQLKGVLQAKTGLSFEGYNKIQGKPFKVSELVHFIESTQK